MIRFKDLRNRLDCEPFIPFLIRVEDGRAFKVVRRNLCILTDRAAYVGVPDPKLRGIVKRVDYCPFDYATGIEELERSNRRRATASRQRRNGGAGSGKSR